MAKIAINNIMSRLEEYKQKPPAISIRLVGVNYETHTILLGEIEGENEKYLKVLPKRKCGIKSSMLLSEQLLLSFWFVMNFANMSGTKPNNEF